eukprot:sb/3463739/
MITKEQDWLRKYEDLSRELHSIQSLPAAVPHNRAELEELVLEQDKNNAQLRDSIFKLRQEISDLKQERKEEQSAREKEKEKIVGDGAKKVEALKGEVSELTKQNSELLVRNKSLSDGLKRGNGENKELVAKDEEIGKLKTAILALKTEMKTLEEKKVKPSPTKKAKKPSDQKPIVSPPNDQVPAIKQQPRTTETWLENKKWAKKVDQLKKSNTQKDTEIETLSRQNSSLKDTIERLDKEKTSLSLKLKKSQPIITTTTAAPKPGPKNTTSDLKDQIYSLEQENAALKLDLAEQSTLPISERDKTIAVLRTTVSDLEQQIRECADKEDVVQFSLIREGLGLVTKSPLISRGGVISLPRAGASRVQEKKLIEAEHRALSLNLQLEHLKLEVPRLRTRVSDLQDHNEVLKKAKPGSAPPVGGRSAAAGGKSVAELERVAGGMRRVIDKLQRENDEQKRELGKLRNGKNYFGTTVGPPFSDILGGKDFGWALNRGQIPLISYIGENLTKSGSNTVNFLYRGKFILSLNRGVTKSGVTK